MPDAIVMEGITKTFGPKVAVREMNLAVPEGALYGFIGPNGAGKTTAIRMIMSILFPDSGRLSVLGKASAVESKDRIGYLPEERGVYKKMKVGSFLKYIGKLKGMSGPGLDRKVREWLERVGLEDCYKKRCDELSKGMQQKVQFIASVLHEPELLIFDEPFSGLDPVNMRLLRDLFLEQHKAGRTILFSTHVMHQAEQLCDHIIMIDQGIKVLDASMDEIHTRYDPRSIVFVPVDARQADAVKSISGITSLTKVDNHFEASVGAEADPTEVVQRIVSMMPVSRIELHRPSLEDVFVNIVGRGVAECEDEAGHGGSRGEETAAGALT